MSTARILIVDDEPDIASLIKMILEYDGPFNNLTMPSIDGLDLYQEMRKIDNKVKFCFLTGKESCCDEAAEAYHSLNGGMFIKKPISVRDLLKEVNKRLDM